MSASDGEKKMALHTVRPAMLTTSLYCSPGTAVDPFPYPSENVRERFCAVELAFGLYNVCPEQFDPHVDKGKMRSLLPVSMSTVSCRGLDRRFNYHVQVECHTNEGHGRCSNRDGAIPHQRVVVGQRIAAAVTLRKSDTPRKRVSYAGIPLICGKSSLNFPISDR